MKMSNNGATKTLTKLQHRHGGTVRSILIKCGRSSNVISTKRGMFDCHAKPKPLVADVQQILKGNGEDTQNGQPSAPQNANGWLEDHGLTSARFAENSISELFSTIATAEAIFGDGSATVAIAFSGLSKTPQKSCFCLRGI